MKILNLVQGSDEWKAVRSKYFTASEASIMMSCSENVSRNDLLKMKATGTEKEFSEWVQKNILDKGHNVESKARPIAESIIGEELYPVTGLSEGFDAEYLASFDGLTMMGNICWECKQYNADKANDLDAGQVPKCDFWQVVQQVMVSDAAKCLYMVTDGTEENTRHIWVTPSHEDFKKLISGWAQFAEDLANYEHTEAKVAPTAAPVLDLPAVSVQVSGELAITDNFNTFEVALRDFIENRLIVKPQTDQDFADLESQIKTLKKAEGALDAAEAQLLGQVATVDQLKRTKDLLHKLARDNRLSAEKLVKSEKEARKLEILQSAKQALTDHITKLSARLAVVYMPLIQVDFAGAMKGKRTISSLQSAADDTLASAKIEANAWADNAADNLRTLDNLASNHRFLFNDLQVIIAQHNDHFELIVKSRIADHEKSEVERREREEAQMRERLEREQQAKLNAEREKIRQQEEQRILAEQQATPKKTEQEAVSERGSAASAQEQHQPTTEPRFKEPTGRKHVATEAPLLRPVEMVEITPEEYRQLKADSALLAALMAAGVDSWDGYDQAIEMTKAA
ncbi:YqaJ viral recombinase family protein [uncultured Amphritea sp.]|uniref:YqaJ viral recombinase family protein n=1 Tax=uncultured Amphritea sp. TaxID=981605 RepID=UPI002622230E|nr:YqaJ viral recombinase family protein [uncultured Amphritea sp.]